MTEGRFVAWSGSGNSGVVGKIVLRVVWWLACCLLRVVAVFRWQTKQGSQTPDGTPSSSGVSLPSR